ncbi:MAG: hypothetical protein R3F61_17050 [Myxococcota bacterium]
MPWFEGSHTESRTIAAPLATVRDHFANPASILANTKGVEDSSVDDGVIHFVMKEEDHGVVKFKGDFRCRYALEGDTLTWTPVGDGNMKQSGKATFTAKGDATVVDYSETVEIDLGVPGMMAPMLKPVISALLANEMKDYVKRMAASL